MAEVFNVAPLFITRGTDALKILALFNVTVPPLIITPPVAANVDGHSTPAVRVELYDSVADAPNVGEAETDADPSMERMPFTVQLAALIVFRPEPEIVRFLNVVEEVPPIVCAVPLKSTVLVFGENVPPLFIQLPLTVKVFEPDIVNVAPALIVKLLQTAPELITG